MPLKETKKSRRSDKHGSMQGQEVVEEVCQRMDGEKWQLQAYGSRPVGPREDRHARGGSKQALERSRGVEGSILTPCKDGSQLVQVRSFFPIDQ